MVLGIDFSGLSISLSIGSYFKFSSLSDLVKPDLPWSNIDKSQVAVCAVRGELSSASVHAQALLRTLGFANVKVEQEAVCAVQAYHLLPRTTTVHGVGGTCVVLALEGVEFSASVVATVPAVRVLGEARGSSVIEVIDEALGRCGMSRADVDDLISLGPVSQLAEGLRGIYSRARARLEVNPFGVVAIGAAAISNTLTTTTTTTTTTTALPVQARPASTPAPAAAKAAAAAAKPAKPGPAGPAASSLAAAKAAISFMFERFDQNGRGVNTTNHSIVDRVLVHIQKRGAQPVDRAALDRAFEEMVREGVVIKLGRKESPRYRLASMDRNNRNKSTNANANDDDDDDDDEGSEVAEEKKQPLKPPQPPAAKAEPKGKDKPQPSSSSAASTTAASTTAQGGFATTTAQYTPVFYRALMIRFFVDNANYYFNNNQAAKRAVKHLNSKPGRDPIDQAKCQAAVDELIKEGVVAKFENERSKWGLGITKDQGRELIDKIYKAKLPSMMI